MLLVYEIFIWKRWMALAAKNPSETFAFKIVHMLNFSTCILLRTEKQKKKRWDLVTLLHSPLYIFHKTRDEGNWSDSQKLSDWACEEKRSCHLTPPYLTPTLEESGQGISLLVGVVLRMGAAAAAEIQTVQDESMRLQNAMAWGQCSPTGVTLNLDGHSDIYWKKRTCPYV